jgi:hypothetical protein
MKLISIERGGLYDTRDGAQLALHLWIGPFGIHIFRRPFSIIPDWDRAWRD